ncbi:MAG: hypothetical protein ABII82_14890 [Verrucomicrobiota bacterium]
MTSPNTCIRLRASLAALLVTLAVPITARALDSVSEWAALEARHNSKGPEVVVRQWLPDADQYAWNAYGWLEGYLSLAQATGDSRYMETAKEILDYMLSKRDDIRFAGQELDTPYHSAPTEYLYNRGTPAPGWRRRSQYTGNQMQVSVLVDARISEIFLRWCEVARKAFPQYEADVTRYLDHIHETLELHQGSFREIPSDIYVGPSIYTPERPAGGYRYWWHDKEGFPPTSPGARVWSGQTALNHSAVMASAMLRYDQLKGTQGYREKVQLIVNYVLNAFDPAHPDKAIWEYDPVNSRRHDIEDIGHAAISLPLLQAAYLDGKFGVTKDHMLRLTKTYLKLFNEETGFPHRYIDGTEKPDEKPGETYGVRSATCFYSWLWFSQFDPEVLTKARRSFEAHFGDRYSSSYSMGGWANLLYWEQVRDGKAAIVDSAKRAK